MSAARVLKTKQFRHLVTGGARIADVDIMRGFVRYHTRKADAKALSGDFVVVCRDLERVIRANLPRSAKNGR